MLKRERQKTDKQKTLKKTFEPHSRIVAGEQTKMRKKTFATHSRSVAETKSKQESIHTSRAVRHSAFYNQLQLVVKGYLRKLLIQ